MSKLVAILLPTVTCCHFFSCNYIAFSDHYFSAIDIYIDFYLITGTEIIYITNSKFGSDQAFETGGSGDFSNSGNNY